VKALIELLMKDRKAQLLTLILTGLLLANCGFYLFRTKPASLKASGLETRLQDNRRTMKAKQDQYRHYASFGRGKEQLESFKKMLPASSDYTGILREVFKMAKEDGVKSNSISAVKKESAQNQDEDIVQISFSMPVTGKYKDVRKFIHDMESSSLFLNIDNLGLDSNEQTGEIAVTLGLTTYARS
jgi:Tfp pilus assembly protein PilO